MTETMNPTDTAYRLASLSRVFVPNAQISDHADLRQRKLIPPGPDGFIALTRIGERLLWSAAISANQKVYGC
jgi:hypothetical protein